jgi:hypothetical protein
MEHGHLPGRKKAVRNGLPEFIPYVYRGTGEDTLTPHLSTTYGTDDDAPAQVHGRNPWRQCQSCGYRIGAPGHKAACG